MCTSGFFLLIGFKKIKKIGYFLKTAILPKFEIFDHKLLIIHTIDFYTIFKN